ncbi:hypothetical protein BSZ35_04130 [Salinibacter sp. 10B]|uniref:hypothetical protein n=1 Tax=Salinibacter sp. 10B TaxID=1923971 RepID=UPI000CF563BA|nr:hypothetical protein [Salinibacter sp. 10B]PQJ33898.1 hypothetical protein BSZ35_04130 [Salinibacter sp. 10B]
MRKELDVIREPTDKEERYVRLIKIYRSFVFWLGRTTSIFLFVGIFFIEPEIQKIGLIATSSVIAYAASAVLGRRVNISYKSKDIIEIKGEIKGYYPPLEADSKIDDIPIIFPTSWKSQIVGGENRVEGYMDDAGVIYAVKIDKPPLSVENDIPSSAEFLLRFM